MKNEFNFNVKIRCGKRTEPEINIYYTGNNDYMSVGNKNLTKEYIANWMHEILSCELEKLILINDLKKIGDNL